MFKRIVQFVSVLTIFTFFLGYLGGYHWVFEIFAHFRVYYLLFFSILIVLTILSKARIYMFINIGMLLLTGWPLLKYYGGPEYQPSPDDVKIVYCNVLRDNHDYRSVIKFLEDEDADIIVLCEVDSGWYNHILPYSNRYRSTKFVIRDDNFGICVMSKFKLYQLKTLNLSPLELPSLGMIFRKKGRYYSVIGTHVIPPMDTRKFNSRNKHFDNINAAVKQLEIDALVIGDMNCTSFSPSFSRISEGTTLTDSRIGFGLQPSWSAKNFLFSIPIDHCLTTAGINVVDRRLGPYVGSDHYPVIVTFRAHETATVKDF